MNGKIMCVRAYGAKASTLTEKLSCYRTTKKKAACALAGVVVVYLKSVGYIKNRTKERRQEICKTKKIEREEKIPVIQKYPQ